MFDELLLELLLDDDEGAGLSLRLGILDLISSIELPKSGVNSPPLRVNINSVPHFLNVSNNVRVDGDIISALSE